MMHRILFVCLGNICRSPAAEVVFRSMAEAAGLPVRVDSAGTGAWHVGEPPYPPMIAAAARRGHDLRPLRARQLVAADFIRFDQVLVMDRSNLRDALALQRRTGGQGALPRLFLEHAPQTGLQDMPDPWYSRDFDQTLDLVEVAGAGLLAALRQPPQ